MRGCVGACVCEWLHRWAGERAFVDALFDEGVSVCVCLCVCLYIHKNICSYCASPKLQESPQLIDSTPQGFLEPMAANSF